MPNSNLKYITLTYPFVVKSEYAEKLARITDSSPCAIKLKFYYGQGGLRATLNAGVSNVFSEMFHPSSHSITPEFAVAFGEWTVPASGGAAKIKAALEERMKSVFVSLQNKESSVLTPMESVDEPEPLFSNPSVNFITREYFHAPTLWLYTTKDRLYITEQSGLKMPRYASFIKSGNLYCLETMGEWRDINVTPTVFIWNDCIEFGADYEGKGNHPKYLVIQDVLAGRQVKFSREWQAQAEPALDHTVKPQPLTITITGLTAAVRPALLHW